MKDFLEKLSAERCTNYEVRNTMDVVQVFDDRDAINAKTLYFSRYFRIPNWIQLDGIDCKKANEWLVQHYRDNIADCCWVKRNGKQHKIVNEIYLDDVYYFLFDDLLVYLNHNQSEVKLLFRKTDNALVDMIVDKIKKFKKRKSYTRKKPEIELLVSGPSGLSTVSMVISKPKFPIEDNYNDDFLPVHQTILERLRKKNDKGLVLLHGKPGTGKTSYIRYLITKTRKPVIFLPPNMAASVSDPGLMNVLINKPNSIFVIEDAENIIIDRNRSGSSSVSALLNLADGLLSDCLNIQIICSFNTDLSRVDSALTRKGRLIAKYEFTELEVAKAQALSNKLGYSSIIASPMTLAAVYNQHEAEFAATAYRKTVGFKIAV
jgi:DNA polymerase III delta prime subunit